MILDNVSPALRASWIAVAHSHEITDAPVRVWVLGEPWVVVRLAGTISAFGDRCPHRLAPLSAGWVDRDPGSGEPVLRCGYHGWCFDAAGACTDIPAIDASAARGDKLPPKARADVPASVAEHLGLIWLAPEPPLMDLPALPIDDDTDFQCGDLAIADAPAGAGLLVDNFLDVAHFPFVHAATIGTEEAEQVGDLVIDRPAGNLAMTVGVEHPFPNHEDPGVAAGVRDLIQNRRLTYHVVAPFSAWLKIEYLEAGGTNVVTFFVQPVDADRCRIYTSVVRNDLDGDEARLAEAVAFEQKILDEDLVIQGAFVQREIPLDLTAEVHTKADRMTVEYRRMLADLVAAANEAGWAPGALTPDRQPTSS